MTYEVRLTSRARKDRDRVVCWYDSEAPGQTERFINEFYVTTRRLAEFPQSARVVRRGARRVSLRVFPYQLWYRLNDEAGVVEVIALVHHRQDPKQLHDRLGWRPSE